MKITVIMNAKEDPPAIKPCCKGYGIDMTGRCANPFCRKKVK